MGVTIQVNGERQEFETSDLTVQDVLRFFNILDAHVVVELNAEIYTTPFDRVLVKDGDILEIVHFMGGGS